MNFANTTTPATNSYVPHTGPESEETWSAYEARATYPEALEEIEVYSLGDAWKTLFEGTYPDKVRAIIHGGGTDGWTKVRFHTCCMPRNWTIGLRRAKLLDA